MSQKTVKILEKIEKTIGKGKNKGKPCWVIKMYSEEEAGNRTITVFSVNHAESLERGKSYIIDVNVQDKEGGIMWDFNEVVEVVAELGNLSLESSPPGPPVASQPSQGQAPIYIGDPVMEATGQVVSAFIGRPDSRLDTRSIQTLIRVTFGTFDALYRNEPPPPEFPKGSPPKADNSSHGNNGADVGTKETPRQGNGKVDVPTGDALRDPFSFEWETPIQVMTAYAKPPHRLSLTALKPFLSGPLRKVQEYKVEELLKAIDGYLHAQDAGAPNPNDLPF